MNENAWSEQSAPVQKKGVPTWLWWVGGGCLFLLLATAVGGFFLYRIAKDTYQEWSDPELQWERVREVLPFDERPNELTLMPAWHIGMDIYVFNDLRGYLCLLMVLPAHDGERTRQELLDPTASYGFMGKFGRREQARSKLTVQGRELDVLKFVQDGPHRNSNDAQGMPSSGPGATAIVDLTRDNGGKPLILQMTRSDGSEGPIPDEAILDFLEPFHVGDQR